MKRVLNVIVNLLLIILGIRLFQELWRKKKDRPCPGHDVKTDSVIAPYIPNQLIVWRKPNTTDDAFSKWKTDLLDKYPGITVKKLCRYCEDSLELWEGDDVTTIITEKTVGTSGGGSSNSDVSGGGDAIASFSRNFIMDLPEAVPCAARPSRRQSTQQVTPRITTPLTVAVFDTGLLDDLKTVYTKDVSSSCMPDGKAGWNFADRNNETNDNHKHFHGSIVTEFIKDQERKYALQAVNILPVKTHNQDGKGDLFSILCGFAYAANCGAKIINASFGFYAAKTARAPEILFEFVQRVLNKRNILLVVAAGNTDANKTIGKPLAARPDVRDLDKNPFFPACLAKDFSNVLAVTTVSTASDDVSPSQNYSSTVVDIGVECDEIKDGDYRFHDPFNAASDIVGSSYATPILTGKIAQHYQEFLGDMQSGIDKDLLLSRMKQKGLLNNNNQLSQYVRNGAWIKKEM